MYINFVNDRKYLEYSCLIDTQCGNRLVLITDSSVAFNESTGDLITGDKQKTPAFNRFKNENYLGGKK